MPLITNHKPKQVSSANKHGAIRGPLKPFRYHVPHWIILPLSFEFSQVSHCIGTTYYAIETVGQNIIYIIAIFPHCGYPTFDVQKRDKSRQHIVGLPFPNSIQATLDY